MRERFKVQSKDFQLSDQRGATRTWCGGFGQGRIFVPKQGRRVVRLNYANYSSPYLEARIVDPILPLSQKSGPSRRHRVVRPLRYRSDVESLLDSPYHSSAVVTTMMAMPAAKTPATWAATCALSTPPWQDEVPNLHAWGSSSRNDTPIISPPTPQRHALIAPSSAALANHVRRNNTPKTAPTGSDMPCKER